MDENTTVTPVTQNKSVFVTVIAWIFIILSGEAVGIALIQNIMSISIDIPTVASEQVFMPIVFLIASGLVMVCSIGLLKRKNYARRAFIIIMVVGIFWFLLCIYKTLEFQIPFVWFTLATIFWALAYGVLFGWIIYKLSSKDIRKEFRRPLLP